MATWEAVARIALALPGTVETRSREGLRQWRVSAASDAVFTTPHFDGYAVVLVQLARVSMPALKELLREAWLAKAPKVLVDELSGASAKKKKRSAKKKTAKKPRS